MKTRTILSLTLLAVILLSTGAFIALSQEKPVGANVAFDPKNYSWDGTPPNPWYAEVWLKQGHKAQAEIDHSTIMLEDQLVTLYAPPYNKTHGPRLVIPFSGWDVKAAVEAAAPHLTPGYRWRLSLKVSGYLKPEYGGLYFEGYGTIVLTIPEPPPP